MSNFTGVTFAQQKVLPSDDAIIRRHILSDGILFGCELSYSGSTLTMAAGQILACGRQFRHPSSQNWAVVDATSGYARLLLTMDLTKTSTKETFDQIEDSIEYASSADGFPDLEQSNVNVSGTRYQVVACVVSLGTGGITGIVSQLGPCEVAGGGGLNFSVVGSLTQPANPKENMIWVNTDTAVTSYIFSATEPAAPEEGMVWITIGTSSTVEFNALKKNGIQVYPISAKQYVSGAWVDVTAKSYQGGEWVDWIVKLFVPGMTPEITELGWKARSDQTAQAPTATVEANAITVKFGTSTGGRTGVVYFPEKKDLSSAKTITMQYTISVIPDGGDEGATGLFVWSEVGTGYYVANAVARAAISNTSGTLTVDVSGLSGEYYVGVGLRGSSAESRTLSISRIEIS